MKQRCRCAHLGQCRFATEHGVRWDQATTLEGKPRFRMITSEDPGAAKLEGTPLWVIPWEAAKQDPSLLRKGDCLGGDERGVQFAYARLIEDTGDEDTGDEDMGPKALKQCRAQSAAWRRRNPLEAP